LLFARVLLPFDPHLHNVMEKLCCTVVEDWSKILVIVLSVDGQIDTHWTDNTC